MEHFRVEETTIADIHAAYRAGAITCVQLTQAYLDRIAAYDQRGPTLNSYVTLNPAALERAAELDAIFASTGEFAGPLHGVPYAVKDQAERPASRPASAWRRSRATFPSGTRRSS